MQVHAYKSQCKIAADHYSQMLPEMSALLQVAIADHLENIKRVLSLARGHGDVNSTASRPSLAKNALNKMHDDLLAIQDQASHLAKLQRLLQSELAAHHTCVPLQAEVQAAIRFLDTKLQMWVKLNSWLKFVARFRGSAARYCAMCKHVCIEP
jgi:septation ring formation regulator EzrA